jgi:DNA polymerase V
MRGIAIAFRPLMTNQQAPYLTVPVTAGVPAENPGYCELLSLDALVANGGDTIYVRVAGDSMMDRGISDGDLLVIHLRPIANNGEAVLARIGDEYTVKNFHELEPYERRRRLYLVPSNPIYSIKGIDERDDFEIIGVVAFILKKP